MPMKEWVRALRERVGTMVSEVPTVAALVLDSERRVLLVRHAEGDEWNTPD